ncbi:MAG: alpha/beta fold hydrolase, partial [Pseudomonadota bacterium]
MAELHRVHTARGADRPHLVFLHGLGGHPRETWMHNPADHTTLWPQWLGEDADCHAWCLGYDAALSGWTDSAMRIPDQAVAVLNALAVERELRSGPWVLVGHSMGGLVVKEAMRCAANREPHFRPMLDRIAAVVFVATPHRGSQLASLAKALRLLLNTNVHVGDMGRNDAYLRAANQEFKVLHNGGRFQALVLAEGHPVKLTRPWLKFFTRVLHVAVVDLDSADPGLHKVPSRPFPEDHFSIAKPSNRKTTLHKTVVDFLLELKASAAPARQIRAEMHVAVDTAAVRESPHTGQPALLTGPDDNRLLPRENKVYGRDAVVEELLAFLRSARDAALVTAREVSGVGGIGKTEVCKAALRAWLKEWAAKGNPLPPAYYVSVPDRSRPDDLIALLATGVGVPQIDSLAQLLAILPNGLYYLDNLESVAEVAEGQAILRALRDRPGIRLLVSSRLSLPTIMGKPVLVDRLPDDDALALFVDTWAGSSTLPSREALRPFVLQDLGAHPLSLALMARLGDCYAYDDLVKRWHALGTTAADDPADDSRHGSLNISLRLTADALAQRDGALDLWTVVALFPEGMDDATLRALEEVGGWASARPWLARHHVLTQRDGLWSVLPPVARFAQAASLRGDAGFQWTRCRAALQQHYAPSLKAADSIASTQEALFARQWLLRQWNNLTALIRHEAGAADKDSGWLERVHTRLYNQYQFNIVASRGLLTDLATHLPNPASAFESLGDLESRLGEPGKARALYDRALAL